jgi:hypothetical protein
MSHRNAASTPPMFHGAMVMLDSYVVNGMSVVHKWVRADLARVISAWLS